MRLHRARAAIAASMRYATGIGGLRLAVGILVFVAWLAVEAASATANLSFALRWAGAGPNQLIVGSFAIASDVLKALMLPAIFWFAAERRWLAMFLSLAIFCVTLPFSVAAAIGYASELRAGFFSEQSIAQRKNEDAFEALNTLNRNRGFIPTHRPLGVVDVDLAAKRGEKAFTLTAGCTRVLPVYAEWCISFRQLLAEQAAAEAADMLEAKIAAQRAEVARIDNMGGDKQIAILASLTGWSPEHVLRTLVLLMTGLVETGSVLGLSVAIAILIPRAPAVPAITWQSGQPREPDKRPLRPLHELLTDVLVPMEPGE
jgi:hypothetical protein